MSFRGQRGRSSQGFRGRGGSNFSRGFVGPPSSIIEAGTLVHSCESVLLMSNCLENRVPYHNGRIFLENKQEIGKVDEILGPIHNFYFSVKVNDNMKISSFLPNTKFYIDTQQVLPLSKFLPSNNASSSSRGTGGKAPTRGGMSRGSYKPQRGGKPNFSSRGSRGSSFSNRGISRGRFISRGTLNRGR